MTRTPAAVAALLFALLGLNSLAGERPELSAFTLAAAAAAITLLRYAPGREHWRVALLLAAPAAIGFAQLAGLGTEDAPATEIRTARWLAAAAVALAAGAAARAAARPSVPWATLFDGLAAAGCLAAIIGFVSLQSGGALPFANRNHLSAWCVLILPVAAYAERITRRNKQPHARVYTWRTGAVIALAGCGMFTGSRAGFALILLEGALLWWLLSTRSHPRTSPPRRLVWGGTLAAILLISCLLAVVTPSTQATPDSPARPWLLYRDQIWQSAWELALDKPWLGHGLGSFRVVYPSRARFDTGETVHRAHNDWLEWWVEGGILAPLSMASLGLIALLHLRRAPWLLGVLLVLVHSLVDYPLDRFPTLAVFAALLSWGVTPHRRASQQSSPRNARKRLPRDPVSETETSYETALQ